MSEVVYFTLGHAPGVEPPIENVHDRRRVEGDPSTVKDADDIRGKYRSHFVVPHLSRTRLVTQSVLTSEYASDDLGNRFVGLWRR